jgi:hypothetical protein
MNSRNNNRLDNLLNSNSNNEAQDSRRMTYQSLRNRTQTNIEGEAILSSRGERNSVGDILEIMAGVGPRSTRNNAETSARI